MKATASPTKWTVPSARGGRGGTGIGVPSLFLAMVRVGMTPSPSAFHSAAVSTASTAGAAAAEPVSIRWMRACAWGERKTRPWAMPSSATSSK
jgi:hypothetical protein